MTTTARALALALASALVAALAGCAGHGKYTSEHLNKSEQRLATLKAANEYDLAHQGYLAGDLDKALKHIDLSIAINPDVPKSHLLRGRVLLEAGDLEGANAALARAVEIDPALVEAHYFQGIVHERFARKDDALAFYLKAADLAPTDAQYAVAAAEMLIDLDRLDDAERFLLDRSAHFEHNAGVRQTLGHIAMIRADLPAALRFFEEARLLAPEDDAIAEDLIQAQMAQGRFADAEFNLARLLKNKDNADRRDLQHLRAQCLVALDRPVEARDAYLALTSGDAGTGDLDAWVALGRVAYQLNDLHRVRLAATRAAALAPERPDGYVLRALWQRRTGDRDGALRSLALAVKHAPEPETFLMLGILQEEAGDFAAARDSFARALELNPDDPDAATALARAEQRVASALGAP